MARKTPYSDCSDLGHMPTMEGGTHLNHMDGEWRGDGVSEGNVDVVTRGENDDQQAKETDVHYTPHPRQD